MTCSPEAIEALRLYLDEEHCEQDVLQPNQDIGFDLLRYQGANDIVGDLDDARIHTLIMLAPHKEKTCWLAYMTGTINGYTIAAVTHHAGHGEYIDIDNEVESIIWIGKGDIPEEVEKAMRAYHAMEVASDYAARLAVMNFSLEDIAQHLPQKGRQAIANSLTKLMRTTIL